MNTGSIKEYFKGKNILITGGTGFIGKALLEKLLRSCPELDKIYVLMRPKNGKALYERLEQIASTSLFDVLRKINPDFVQKLIPVNGDTTQIGLGLSNEDRQLLVDNVNMFFHAAASVKFDDFLKTAILTNLRSAKEAAHLAIEMKQIEVFLHVSTTYSNINNGKVVEPILYPPHGNWRDVIMIAEECDTETLNVFSRKFLDEFPNTYTYTKHLAEHCINDMLIGKVPTVVFRPSVVVSSILEPFPGWIDNFNGPLGIMIAVGTGIMRTIYGDSEVCIDFIAVDNIVNSMIVSVWYKAEHGNTDNLDIYNGSNYNSAPIKLSLVLEYGKKIIYTVPFEKTIWFPHSTITKCWHIFFVNVILFHMIPAFFIDLILRATGHRPMMVKIQRKIYIGNMALSFFMLNEWKFINTKTLKLVNWIPKNEMEEFRFDIFPISEEEKLEYFIAGCDKGRQILLKEDGEIKEKTRVMMRSLYYLDSVCHWIFYGVVLWMVCFKIDIPNVAWRTLCNYWDSL